MTGRLFAVGVGVASVLALAFGAIVPACYSPPEPICGFVCGSAGECPDDYTCATADHRCHLNGAPMMTCGAVDAGLPDGRDSFVIPDTLVDADIVDVPRMIDAQVDAMPDAGVDAMADAAADAAVDATPDASIDAMDDAMDDAMVDAAPMVDAPPDGPPDATIDAAMADSAPDAPDDAGVSPD